LAALLLGPPSVRAKSGLESTHPAPASVSDPVAQWRGLITEAAGRFEISVNWICAVMRAESAGRREIGGRRITSRAGAMGLMQIMPQTYDALRRRYGLGDNPYDPHDNILAGAAYLRELYDRYGYPKLFAAYNAGPGRLEDNLKIGRPLPDETIVYLTTLSGFDAGPNRRELADSRARWLFVPRTASPSGEVSLFAHAPPPGTLFVALRTARG
jgi:soluble lytic murein transglycosylase-like protein